MRKNLGVGVSMLAMFGAMSPDAAIAGGVSKAVFTMSNAVAGNELLAYSRDGNGALTPAGVFATEGIGSGGGLGNQGAVSLSSDDAFVLVVNAGSNSVSVFSVVGVAATLTDVESSGGMRPVSVAIRGDLVYVLNAMGPGNVSGFRLDESGDLSPIPDSTRPLSGAAMTGAAQVGFNPDGDVLVVTEKATNLITTYTVGEDGLLGAPFAQPSIGMTPFGFGFEKRGRLIVSEAFGGAPDASALSSYDVDNDGALTVISPSVPTTETAACWIVTTSNGRFTYTTNTASGTVSAYAIDEQTGTLSLLDDDGIAGDTGAGSTPLDAALTINSRFLYVLSSDTGRIDAFRVNGGDGSLTKLTGIDGLPVSANGLAAR